MKLCPPRNVCAAMRFPDSLGRFLILAITLALTSVAGASEDANARIARLFAPLRTETASLSPDGKYLAYSEHEAGQLNLVIVALESNRARRIEVAEDYMEPMSGHKERLPSRLTYLGWKSATRLIFSVNDYIIWAINADGTQPKRLIGARDVRTDFEEKRRRNPIFNRMSGGPASSRVGPGGRRRVVTPDMSADTGFNEFFSPPPDEEDTAEEDALPTEIDTADIFSGYALAWNTDRHPIVADLLTDDPENLLVEARSNTGLLDDAITLSGAEMSATLFRINVHTGKTRTVDEVDAAARLFPDRSGKPRLALHYFSTSRTFNYHDGRRWRKLDDVFPAFADAPFQLTPENFLGRHSFPLGFDAGGQVLYFGSNAGRDSYGIYALDLKTGERMKPAIEHAQLDLVGPSDALRSDVLVYDRFRKSVVGARLSTASWPSTAWMDPELAALQQHLEASAKDQIVQILEWDEKRETFLVHVSDGNDPGSFATLNLASGKLVVRAPCEPELPTDRLNPSRPFTFQSPAGVRLSGVVTYPRESRLKPPPVLLYFHDGPWGCDVPGFNRGSQALATMGFAVIQVNYRGSSGYGLQHLTGTKTDRDRSAVEDGLAALEFLAGHLPLNQRLVAALGTGYGGYLALRAVQLHPERLRAAVAINAPTDLGVWLNQPTADVSPEVVAPPESFRSAVRRALFGGDFPALKAMSPVTHAGATSTPVLLIHGNNDRIVPPMHSVRMRNALRNAGTPVNYVELPAEGHANWRPGTSTHVFREIEMFVNEHIYNYAVKIGEPTAVP